MLHKDVRSLERALQEAGLRADPGSLQFSLGGQSNNSSGQTAAKDGSGGDASGNTASDASASGTPLDVSASSDEIYYLTPGRVNLKV
jgi:flagellar hook-length control protein FliK